MGFCKNVLMRFSLSALLSCFALLALCSSRESIAQTAQSTRQIDSLQTFLKRTHLHDTIRADAMNELSVLYLNTNAPDKARSTVQASSDIARRAKWWRGYSRTFRILGAVARVQGNFPEALKHFQMALAIAEEHRDSVGMAGSLNNIGVVHRARGEYDLAVGVLERVLRLAERLRDTVNIANATNNIGLSFLSMKQYDKAIEFFRQAFPLYVALRDRRSQAIIYGNIGDAYYRTVRYVQALKEGELALSLFEKNADAFGMARMYNFLGDIFRRTARYDDAVKQYELGLAKAVFLDAKVLIVQARTGLAVVYAYQSKFRYTDSLFVLASEMAQILSNRELTNNVLEARYLIARQKRELDVAIVHYDQWKNFVDSTTNLEKLTRMSELQTKYDTEKKQAEIESLNRQQQLQELELDRTKAHARAESIEAEIQRTEAQLQTAEAARAKAESERQMQINTGLEKDKRTQKVELDRQAIQLYAGIVVLLLLGILAAVLVYAVRRKQKDNAELMRQQNILEEQAAEIEMINTQLHEQNELLHEHDREKNVLLGIVAHDLKNPLTGIALSVEMLQSMRHQMTPDKINAKLSGIEQTVERMRKIIGDLLDVNALESGTMSLIIKPCDMRSIVRRTIDDYIAPASRKDIFILYTPPEVPCIVMLDEERLSSILDNIISNAVKYSPQEKNIHIALTVIESPIACRVRLSVRDEGQGMTDDDMSKLFGKFMKLSARPTAGEHSTGLGLSIAKKLVEAMHGTIWCESVYGEGATFFVEFPMLVEERSSSAEIRADIHHHEHSA
jgi:signal transduction histidine kinase